MTSQIVARRVGFEFRRDDVIGRQQQLEILGFGVGKEPLGELEFVVFDERLADLQSLRFFERVGHAAADEHHSAIFMKFSTTSILSLTFAPPMIATNGRAGFVIALPM